jgi:hypothetical protein
MAKTRKGITRKTSGDVLRVNVTPYEGKKTNTFPWVRIFTHPHGIRHTADRAGVIEEGPWNNESKQNFVKRLGVALRSLTNRIALADSSQSAMQTGLLPVWWTLAYANSAFISNSMGLRYPSVECRRRGL